MTDRITNAPHPFDLDRERLTAMLHRERRMHHVTAIVLIVTAIAGGAMVALAMHLRAENTELRTRVEGDAMYHRVTTAYGTNQHLMSFCASLDGDGMVCWRSE